MRTDVYGLGVLAYELLVGESPFACFAPAAIRDGGAAGTMTPWQALDALRRAVPRRASVVAASALPAHARALRGDLETILARAIAPDATARYTSVAAFADDLRAYLDGRPVQARPAGRVDRAWKFCKRHPFTVSLATTLSVALLTVAAVALWQAARAERAAAEAQTRTVALRQIARTMIFDVNDALAEGTTAARGKLLTAATQFLDGLNAAQSPDLSLKRDTAEAFERLGDIAGNASQSNLGNAHAAEVHYGKALLLREQLLRAHPDGFDEAGGMVKIHQRLARMALDRGAADEARKLAQIASSCGIVEKGMRQFVVCSGGGPSIMEAANRGAVEAGAETIGLNIVLPHEQAPNQYVTPHLAFQFHYFALRKMHFLLRAKAVAVFPGGFGTFDEFFELLTLVQTGKMKPIPILLFGGEFWSRVVNFEALAEEGVINFEDLKLFHRVETADEAWAKVVEFYDLG
mgnify:CR=1 FL=1